VIPKLHIVTDDEILRREDFLSRAARVLESGGGEIALHLRGPRTTGRALYSLARALKDTALASGSTFLANDRVDLALALDLSGAHLGQRSLPPEMARDVLGPHRLLGLSVHGAEEAREGLGGAVDFLLAGTIFPSASHPEGVPGGVARIREIQRITPVPLLAIGGITPEKVGEILAVGAHGVAVRGGIWDAEDPILATRVYLNELGKGAGK
jgi:thiamine-phosphate pyrophosphorylase